MKQFIHYLDKHEDIAETLRGLLVVSATVVAILGFAPFIMWLS